MNCISSFESCLYAIPQRIRRALEFLPESLKSKAEEIRLRIGLPVTLTVSGKTLFLTSSGQLSDFISRDLIISQKNEVYEAFSLLCANSVYAHTDEIKKGYVIMRSGHRAGVCGTVIADGMKDISSVNIRIAREISGCADKLIERFDGGGVLIAGPPGSGKTTLLRDFLRQLSNGATGTFYRIAVIDSRGELSGSYLGECYTDLGANTDVLMCENKAEGALMALRTMYPHIIAFDEIGTADELDSVSESFNAGVSIITTAHIGNSCDLKKRSVTRGLLESGIISLIAVLPRNFSEEIEFLTPKEIIGDLDN
ncbi:MAG: AAA family ATPase [Ruminococcaceae bacterium]|nr:AAA family ATPase [Oscillospiraceae bacterium]